MSRWERSREGKAVRPCDGAVLQLLEEGWFVGKVRVVAPRTTNSLDEAIENYDQEYPPSGWIYVAGEWRHGDWKIVPSERGWSVYRSMDGEFELASVQHFLTVDRARGWSEIRFDRKGMRLKGPKPRAGKRATKKFPDVRATEEEKEQAMLLLKEVGVNYSQFVRASLAFVEENVLNGEWKWDSDSLSWARQKS
jgi:hypothetical protein